MNENKFSPPLRRAGGGGGGVHDSEGGLPFKGAAPSPPLRGAGQRAERGAGGCRRALSCGGTRIPGSAHRTRARAQNTHARTCACTRRSALPALAGAPSHGDPATESPTPAHTQKLPALREVTPSDSSNPPLTWRVPPKGRPGHGAAAAAASGNGTDTPPGCPAPARSLARARTCRPPARPPHTHLGRGGGGGPRSRAGGGPAPHQARQGGRGGMARAAAGQERSPRPPSGRGAHGPGTPRSQLALASRLSSIHLRAPLRQLVQEPERNPLGPSA